MTPVIDPDYRWVFEPGSVAVEKLDGTNVSVSSEPGGHIYNRTNEIPLFGKGSKRFVIGVLNAIERGYYIPQPEQVFGELIGPKVQGNVYGLEENLWIPFDHLKMKYSFRFWPSILEEIAGWSDAEIYAYISDIFKGLWSVFKRAHGGGPHVVNENTLFEGSAAEGIVFYSPDGRMAKLRRDMFNWWKGKRHGYEVER
ncbi:MAG: RNA ligase family protein [Deltaproteobacteria bacterium]